MKIRILFAVAAGVLAASCGGGTGTTTGTSARSGDANRQAGTARAPHDPCSLLERTEIEAVTGPLAGPPFRTREASDLVEPVQGGDACAYETPDFRSIVLSVTWNDGAMALKAVSLPGRLMAGATASNPAPEAKAAKTMLPGGLQVAGEWDRRRASAAARSLRCAAIRW